MAGGEVPEGPSMTEILASIKRIISEDDGLEDVSAEPAGDKPDVKAEKAEVVELYGNRSDVSDDVSDTVLVAANEDEGQSFSEDDTLELTAMVEDDGTIISLEDTAPAGDIVVDMSAAPAPIDVIQAPSTLLKEDTEADESGALLDSAVTEEISPSEIPVVTDPSGDSIAPEPGEDEKQEDAEEAQSAEKADAESEIKKATGGVDIEKSEGLIPVEEKAVMGNPQSSDPNEDYWIAEEKDDAVAEADSMAAAKSTATEAQGRRAILSADTAAVAGAAFAQLAESSKPTGQSVDEMVRELLRPLLQEWLDDNLPPLVEKMIDREIARISGREDVP